MENVNKAEPFKDLPPTDVNQLPKDPNTTRAVDNICLNDCFIDVTPGTSKYCSELPNIEESHKVFEHLYANEESSSSFQSMESFVCRICQNCENPEKLVSPCLCKGTLTYVHINCLERWISMSRCTTCELCQFQYKTEQTLRYTLIQSLRIWYSRAMSRRALQEDCQMFSLLTLVAFGIVGTLLVAVQYYILQGHVSGFGRLWTKGWLIFFLFTTLAVYLINAYMIFKSQLLPWYRWWQSARDIRLILQNHKPYLATTTSSPCQESKEKAHYHHNHQRNNNVTPQQDNATANATNQEICQQQQNAKSLEQPATKVNSPCNTTNGHCDKTHHCYSNQSNDNKTTTYQNINESTVAKISLCLGSTAKCYSNNIDNNNQLLEQNDNKKDNCMTGNAMALDEAITAYVLYATSTTTATPTATIAKDNNEMPYNNDMHLKSPHFLAVV